MSLIIFYVKISKKGYFKNMTDIKIKISPKFLIKNQYLLE